MLRSLELVGVGPARRLKVDLGPRLNAFAGDNGLGKSFVLEVLWWALTGTWAELPAWPRADAESAQIALEIEPGIILTPPEPGALKDSAAAAGPLYLQSRFDFATQEWSPLPLHFSEEPLAALVLFARADGSFALWDPARNHHRLRPAARFGSLDEGGAENPALVRRPPAYVFDTKELWNGLIVHGKTLCNGLIRDWVSWQQQQPAGAAGETEFDQLSRILAALSPHPDRPSEVLRPGRPARIFIDDTRDFPTIELGYGAVPVIHASAGLRRILALAYLIVWAWREHLTASRLLRRAPARQIVFLMDEVENHLHPAWQRRIVGALLGVLEGLDPSMRVQAHLTTHAPLVLASLEPIFDPGRDRLLVFDLDAAAGTVALNDLPWAKQGDVSDWLTSQAFKLEQARSLEAERAILDAEALMRGGEPVRFRSRAAIDAELHRVLPGDDVFWPRWLGGGGEPAS